MTDRLFDPAPTERLNLVGRQSVLAKERAWGRRARLSRESSSMASVLGRSRRRRRRKRRRIERGRSEGRRQSAGSHGRGGGGRGRGGGGRGRGGGRNGR